MSLLLLWCVRRLPRPSSLPDAGRRMARTAIRQAAAATTTTGAPVSHGRQLAEAGRERELTQPIVLVSPLATPTLVGCSKVLFLPSSVQLLFLPFRPLPVGFLRQEAQPDLGGGRKEGHAQGHGKKKKKGKE